MQKYDTKQEMGVTKEMFFLNIRKRLNFVIVEHFLRLVAMFALLHPVWLIKVI